ncbi:MAG: hypothetical protein LBC41_13535 [Clostridiales bacterium]|nr:hypothetical protein [Clostridiales bacterium]
MQGFFESMLGVLRNPAYGVYVFAALMVLFAFALVLRIVLCARYQTQYALFKMNAKDVESRKDLEKMKSGMLRNIALDYARSAERNSSGVHLDAIVKKHMLKISVLGWSCDSMERFLSGFELALPVAGLALALLMESDRTAYGVASIGMFLVFKLGAAFFDFSLSAKKLEAESIEYVEREVGQFYAGDFGTVLLRFKNETTAALKRQAEILKEAITKQEENLSGALHLAMKGMSTEMSQVSASLDGPLKLWAGALEKAAGVQDRMGETFSAFKGTADELQGSAKALDEALKSHKAKLAELFSALAQNTESLSNSGRLIFDSGERFASGLSVLEKQLDFISANQQTLESAVAKYEQSLEAMTQKVGDSLGSILDFHIESSYGAMSKGIQENIGYIANGNQELLSRIKSLFDQMSERSRGETSAIIHMAERISGLLESRPSLPLHIEPELGEPKQDE